MTFPLLQPKEEHTISSSIDMSKFYERHFEDIPKEEHTISSSIDMSEFDERFSQDMDGAEIEMSLDGHEMKMSPLGDVASEHLKKI